MTAMNDTSRECGGGVVEPGELEGWGWELGSVLRDCARCWENVLGSSEEGLGEERTRGGEGGQGKAEDAQGREESAEAGSLGVGWRPFQLRIRAWTRTHEERLDADPKHGPPAAGLSAAWEPRRPSPLTALAPGSAPWPGQPSR